MLFEEIRSVGCEACETLAESAEGALVAARGPDGEDVVLYVPRVIGEASAERDRLEALAGPGIPGVRSIRGESFEALAMLGAEGARRIAEAGKMPDAIWRPGVVCLLSCLSQAHGNGLAHGRLADGHVLLDPSGRFWVWGWAGARPVSGRGAFQTGFDEIGTDLRDLGLAFVRHLGAPQAEGDDASDAAVLERARARIELFDSELARVLTRLVTVDPRESYLDAGEVLTDLGERDQSLPDPWADVEFVARRGIVRRILAHTERVGTRDAWLASFEVAGGPGSGRTRLLDETARRARKRGFVVMRASGSAPHQPWGAVGAFARQLLARLPAGHPVRDTRGVRVLVGEEPSPVPLGDDRIVDDGASSALAELVEHALRGQKGLLLLDDEDALSTHARKAWRSLGRHVGAAAGTSEPLRVLLVSASSQPAESELSAPRERVDLGELSRRHVAHLLGSVLQERGRAAVVADEIVSAVGGLPADVIDCLRDLVRRGQLVRHGARYTIADPAGTVSAAAPHDTFRARVERAGRDACALAEAAAVAGRLRLPRDVLAEIAAVPAHRMHDAGAAALAAALVRREGATWRVASESLRRRLEHALPDDRRRSLHREILEHLLGSAAPDWPAVALHGRAAGDSRAAEWTRRALVELREAHRYQEAASHFDDARLLLPPGSLDVSLRLEQVDTLLHAGRLDDAQRVAAEVRDDPLATPLQRGHAVLALARLHRYDQAWSKVLAVELPEDCGDPLVLAQIRLLKATAHVFCGQARAAEREGRLAEAESSAASSPGPDWATALCDSIAIRTSAFRSAADGRPTCLRYARAAYRSGEPLHRVLALVRVALNVRHAGDRSLSSAILTHAARCSRRHLSNSPFVGAIVADLRRLLQSDGGHRRSALYFAQLAAALAERASTGPFSLNFRIRALDVSFRYSNPTATDRARLRALASQIEVVDTDVVRHSGAALANLLLLFGMHQSLQTLLRRVRESGAAPWCRRVVESRWLASLLLIDAPPEAVGLPAEPTADDLLQFVATHRRLDAEAAPMLASEHRSASPGYLDRIVQAYCIRRGYFGTPFWPPQWALSADSLGDEREVESSWMAIDLLASMSLHEVVVTDNAGRRFRARVPEDARAWVPTTAQWRRSAALARQAMLSMRVVDAATRRREARHLIGLLDQPEFGEFGALTAAKGRTILGRLDRPRGTPPPTTARAAPTAPVAPAFGGRELVRCISGSGLSAGADSMVHSDSVCAGAIWALTALGLSAPEAVLRLARARRCRHDVGPHAVVTLSAAEVDRPAVGTRTVLEAVLGHDSCVLVTDSNFRVLCGSSNPTVRALALRCSGTTVTAATDRSWNSQVDDLLEQVLARSGTRAPRLLEDARAKLREHDWPGGLDEFVTIVRALLDRVPPGGELSGRVLDGVGWSARSAGRSSDKSEAEFAVLRVLGRDSWLASGEVATTAGISLRTAQRVLARLSARAQLRSIGRGRATRYAAL